MATYLCSKQLCGSIEIQPQKEVAVAAIKIKSEHISEKKKIGTS